jgi:hypothetical protein
MGNQQMPGAEEILKDVFIRPDFDRARVVVTLKPPDGCSRVTWRVAAGKRTIGAGKLLRPGRRARFACAVPDFTPWTVDRPFLYTLVLRFAGKPGLREVRQDFGMRKFHVAGNCIHLNNRPFYIRGVIRGREAHDHPDLCGLSERGYFEKYIRAAKLFGFNFVRFHSKVPPTAWFDAADRLGILTHIEVRKYYGKYQAERDLMDHDPSLVKRRDWVDAIKRIRNHASLMVYCLGNEINAPGRNPEVAERAAQLRRLDPTRLFIDTCARGEYDRSNIDMDVQHMGYFAPFGRNGSMFDSSANWAIFGSVRGGEMAAGEPGALVRREVPVSFPVAAHEVCHYVALRDLDALERKFAKYGSPGPWWIDELRRLRKEKGLEKDYPKMLEASQRFRRIWHKQCLESVRRSPILVGFHLLQLADTDRYENSNGLIDCFDELKPDTRPEDYRAFNGDTVIVADLPRRTFFEQEKLAVPVWLSNCSQDFYGEARLEWKLSSGAFALSGRMDAIEVRGGLSRIATLDVTLPATAAPRAMDLRIALTQRRRKIENAWPLWLYPDRPETLAIRRAAVSLRGVDLRERYRRLEVATRAGLLIADRFGPEVFAQLERGGDVLMLYRVSETRDRQALPERYYLPATWDRFKPVIWDRGHNLGGFLRRHPAVAHFPTDGFLDFQFAGLIDDCDKIDLDDFPARVDPIIEGVDKASRDRYDVFTFKLRELQPLWTMRKFAYLFDLRVGRGRLMVSGFNFTGLGRRTPEAAAMFESLASCVTSRSWRPKSRIGGRALREYLERKGREPRIKERMMTQYWQLDAEPLESARYWKEAQAWIRKG